MDKKTDDPQTRFEDYLSSGNFHNMNSNWDIPKSELDDKIRERESWFKLISWGIIEFFIVVLLVLFIYNLWIGNIKLNFSDLRFSDLLSLTMAIFAIFLSLAFYFKATDTSNIFYNNTYRFTSHVSELLGRIESGFEERLRQIDKGQSDLIGRVDKLPSYFNPESTKNSDLTQKEINEENVKLQKEVEERQKIISELLSQTALQEHDKEKILNQLKEKDKSIDELKKELGRLKQLARIEKSTSIRDPVILREIAVYLRKNVIDKIPVGLSRQDFIIAIEHELEFLDPSFVFDLKKYGLIDNKMKLTKYGMGFVFHMLPKSERP